MHSTNIDESDLFLEERANVGEAESTHITGDHTYQKGENGLGDNISTGTNSHASGKSSIENDFDIKLVSGESGSNTGR